MSSSWTGSISPNAGRQQALLYANALEEMTGQRPMMFTTNGFETYFWDDKSAPQHPVSGLFSKEDLQRLMNRRYAKKNLHEIPISDKITGRYYQKEAIRAVCDQIESGFRKNLLVMATGTGKTRTAAGLVDVLSRGGYVTNVLFLADRTALVKQAKEAFQQNLPEMSLCNLCSSKDDRNARVVFSTYPTMLNSIDDVKTGDGMKLFAPAHFDMIIIDEYEIIGLNLKSQLNQGFRGLVLFLLTLKIADKAIHRRQYAQNRNLSAERGAASMCSASTRHTLPTYISFRRSTELSARVDLHRLPLRHSTHVLVARAA